MAKVAYTSDQRLAVVALAEVSGAPAAAAQFGIDVDTVRTWQRDAVPSSALGRAVELALSKVTLALSGGNVRPRDAAVMYGILRDKAARYDRPIEADEVDPEAEQVALADAVAAEVERVIATYPERDFGLGLFQRLRVDTLASRVRFPSMGPFFDAWTGSITATLPHYRALTAELAAAGERPLEYNEALDLFVGPVSTEDPRR